MKPTLPLAAAATLLAACHPTHTVTAVAPAETAPHAAIPRAIIYRTSAPSDSLVPIQLSADGTKVISFPAPSDLTPQSLPVRLTDGWLLDRRGITPSTVFTGYTYTHYPSPTPAALIRAVNPDVRITEIIQLPLSITQATPAAADSLIHTGLPGCKKIL